jgi:carbonic anhydrase
VRADVADLRSSPLIPDDVPVRGFVYDVRTGTVREVPVDATATAGA